MGGEGLASRLYRAMKDGRDAEVKRLIADHRADLNTGPEGCVAAPLISAVWSERLDYLQALLDAGADPDVRDLGRQGSSHNLRALEAALWFEREDMAAALRAAGATPDFGTTLFSRDVEGVRAAVEADPELLGRAYIRHDYTLLHVGANLSHAGLTRLFLELGLDPNATDGDGHGPLRYAARNKPALDVVQTLVEGGADVNHASHTGITALTATCRHAQSLPTVRWLLEHGADPNRVPKNRVSALMKAAGNRVPEMVRLLLEHGADPDYVGKNGETAADVARRRRAEEVLAVLATAR